MYVCITARVWGRVGRCNSQFATTNHGYMLSSVHICNKLSLYAAQNGFYSMIYRMAFRNKLSIIKFECGADGGPVASSKITLLLLLLLGCLYMRTPEDKLFALHQSTRLCSWGIVGRMNGQNNI